MVFKCVPHMDKGTFQMGMNGVNFFITKIIILSCPSVHLLFLKVEYFLLKWSFWASYLAVLRVATGMRQVGHTFHAAPISPCSFFSILHLSLSLCPSLIHTCTHPFLPAEHSDARPAAAAVLTHSAVHKTKRQEVSRRWRRTRRREEKRRIQLLLKVSREEAERVAAMSDAPLQRNGSLTAPWVHHHCHLFLSFPPSLPSFGAVHHVSFSLLLSSSSDRLGCHGNRSSVMVKLLLSHDWQGDTLYTLYPLPLSVYLLCNNQSCTCVWICSILHVCELTYSQRGGGCAQRSLPSSRPLCFIWLSPKIKVNRKKNVFELMNEEL